MAQTKLLLAKLLDEENKKLPISTESVVDVTRKKTLAQLIDSILTSIDGLKGGDVEDIKTELAALKTTVTTFLTGEADDNEVIDRLSELVKEIQANKSSIDALVSDKATKEALDAVIADVEALQAKAHEHANQTVLDGISKSETTGNLVFNGKELNGETGIAYGATAAEAVNFNGKLKIVLEEIDWEDGTTPAPEEPGTETTE